MPGGKVKNLAIYSLRKCVEEFLKIPPEAQSGKKTKGPQAKTLCGVRDTQACISADGRGSVLGIEFRGELVEKDAQLAIWR